MNLYIDNINGNDIDGSSLYKTLDYVLDYISTLSDTEYNIYLQKGSYDFKMHSTLFNQAKTVNIYGKQLDTIITQIQNYYSGVSSSSNFTLNMHKLIYNMNSGLFNYFYNFVWNFYNVVFDSIPNNNYEIFAPETSSTFDHCTKVTNSTGFLRATNKTIILSNSYGDLHQDMVQINLNGIRVLI